ncbi:proline dehydrogenase family protein [Actinospica sp. MGRD01-02]|uniref:proline dehydrogenase n=1 Tax=Actinospica acidithermotolerans TaxID=2828514 RepID=A0A941IIK8_9ACTN|nr:proline dehydrogenase family protein [Actinospica acidithermotolerans]
MLSTVLLRASRSPFARRAVTSIPVTRKVVDRFVAGEDMDAAISAVRALKAQGLYATLDHLGEDTTSAAQAAGIRDSYVALLARLKAEGLADAAEVSVKLSALGQALPGGGEQLALDNARAVCVAAADAGTTVTLDMEDHTTIDSTLRVLKVLREDYPWVGAVLQSMLHRTEQDCRDLAYPGSRVRLVKGAYAEPASVAHQDKPEVDAAYERCLAILMAGGGYPMVASHDSRMIRAGRAAAQANGRTAGDHEFQMLYGIRQDEQLKAARAGERMRVYVPFGTDWYGYFMRRLAERPANVAFFLRALIGR